jgi:hypothetical protein
MNRLADAVTYRHFCGRVIAAGHRDYGAVGPLYLAGSRVRGRGGVAIIGWVGCRSGCQACSSRFGRAWGSTSGLTTFTGVPAA